MVAIFNTALTNNYFATKFITSTVATAVSSLLPVVPKQGVGFGWGGASQDDFQKSNKM